MHKADIRRQQNLDSGQEHQNSAPLDDAGASELLPANEQGAEAMSSCMRAKRVLIKLG
jgi:hypothetical protein